jgi:Tfp pilus assembly protein PilX
MSPYCNKEIIKHHKEAGMTLVVTLLLMLTLTVMASAVLFVVNNHADMTNTVTNKPIAIDSSNACIE